MAGAQILPWLQPRGDPGAEYLSAFHAGAQIAQEQSRLKADAEKAAMAAAERAQVAQQDALQAQQKIEIDKAYQQSQLGLRKQALDQAGQKIKMAAEGAARRFSAQQQIKQAIAGGMSPDEAYLKFGADAFTSMAGVAPLAKEVYQRAHPFTPTMREVEGERLIQVSPNRFERANLPQGIGPIRTQPVLDESGKPIPGMISVPTSKGGSVVRNVPKQVNPAEKELARLEKLHDADIMGQSAAAADEKSLSKFRQSQRKTFLDRQSRIEELKRKLATPQETPKGRITVISPEGKRGTLPAEQLDEAIKHGWKQVE